MSIYYIEHDAEPTIGPDYDIENHDPSLGVDNAQSLSLEIGLNLNEFCSLFLSRYTLEYICEYQYPDASGFRVVTHPYDTNTCFEKAEILGSWDPLNIIKVFYLESSMNGLLYAIVVPETGCFIDRAHIKHILNIPEEMYLRKAKVLPVNMSFGTCSPFILEEDLVTNGGRVDKILFDTETLALKQKERTIDDFSFGLDHRMSIQMNYYDCFMLLKQKYPDVVKEDRVLKLSFKEKLVRNKGKIKIAYEFYTINYRTAMFINSIHGYGDVSITNDYIDELNLPDVLTTTELE